MESKGEQAVAKWLNENNINYMREFADHECKLINTLLFDFAIFDNNKKLIGLIEFQGGQHYRAVEYFGGEDGFKLNQARDASKRNYCKENNIPLLEISYTKFDQINEILKEFIEKISIKTDIIEEI